MNEQPENQVKREMKQWGQDCITGIWMMLITLLIILILQFFWKPIIIVGIAAIPFLIGYYFTKAWRRGTWI